MWSCPMETTKYNKRQEGKGWLGYRNTIAGSSPGERIFIYFEKIKLASQKIEFLNFCYLAKKKVKMTLNGLEITKFSKN